MNPRKSYPYISSIDGRSFSNRNVPCVVLSSLAGNFRVFLTCLVRSLSRAFGRANTGLRVLVARMCAWVHRAGNEARERARGSLLLANERRRVRCAVARWGNDDVCAQRLGLASVARNLATRDARRFVDGDRAAEIRIFNSRGHFPGAPYTSCYRNDTWEPWANVARRKHRRHRAIVLWTRDYGRRSLTSKINKTTCRWKRIARVVVCVEERDWALKWNGEGFTHRWDSRRIITRVLSVELVFRPRPGHGYVSYVSCPHGEVCYFDR